eukprot:GHVR01161562.1.p1 GENE.GHVR01161562.1~~GHVR01161562.1.p1  ORF type:complete len:127 (+),score=1.92 GHVR01161562.1:310-690(+)
MQPIYLYYGLNGFYQNHRRYMKFFSPDQLENGLQYDSVSEAEAVCGTGFTTNTDLGYTSLTGTDVAFPCGTIAKAFFQMKPEIESFGLKYSNGTAVALTTSGIAWPSDIGRHKNYDIAKQGFDVTD